MPEDIYVVKASGEREPFDITKLDHSLRRSKAPDQIINEVVEEITSSLKEGMTTSEIYAQAFKLLRHKESKTAIRYSLRRAIMELGPTGFPFERLIGEILKTEGFSVEHDQMVPGRCVEHEIDIVAYDPHKLIMIEAKYHNSVGVETDLKVALYIKARIDDLSEATFSYGGKKRKLSEGWLVTNTKFTTTAIKYAECRGIKIFGWNYPASGNLHDMIESKGLHPLTCLTALSTKEKQELLKRNIVLARNLVDETDLMRDAGISAETIENVKREVSLLYS